MAENKKVCPYADKCGGCRYINGTYEEQKLIKERTVKHLIGQMVALEPFIGMKNPYCYRNKVHAAFCEDRRHNILSGVYEESTHKVVAIDKCMIENAKADAIIGTIKKLMPSFKIRPYNEYTGMGLLRHVLIRVANSTGQIMVVLVLTSPIMPSKNNFVNALRKEHPEITTVVVNVNDRFTSMVLGEKESVIYGKGYIEDELMGMRFRISSKSFYQVNPVQTAILYKKAMEYASLTGKEVVVDAYCGTGTIGMIAAKNALKVIGVELNGDAVKDARNNAKANKVENIEFYKKDAGEFLTDMVAKGLKADVIMMDPPRAGSDEAFLNSVVKIAPKRIVYISCNPETLKRDMEYLKKNGYVGVKGVGVDMFPWTEHVETVVLLEHVSLNN